jgi:hypothetical protein
VAQIRPARAGYILMPAAIIYLDYMTCPTSLRFCMVFVPPLFFGWGDMKRLQSTKNLKGTGKEKVEKTKKKLKKELKANQKEKKRQERSVSTPEPIGMCYRQRDYKIRHEGHESLTAMITG